MKKVIQSIILSMIFSIGQASALLVDDVIIESTTGSGSHRAFFVIDFDENSQADSYTFEYRWDPSLIAPTGWDMLVAIDAAEPDLLVTSGGEPGQGFGVFLTDVSYLANSRGSSAAPVEFWAYWNAEGPDPDLPSDWTLSDVSISARELSDMSWDGLSIPFQSVTPFAAPPAPDVSTVPLPAAGWLFMCALIGLRYFRT
ncbi:MAG: hypothetical protein ACU84Q_11345 [Gammaproteobacteria bacterium]